MTNSINRLLKNLSDNELQKLIRLNARLMGKTILFRALTEELFYRIIFK